MTAQRPRSFRRVATRGVIVNGVYLVGLNFLSFIKGFIAAALVAPADFGIWGILSVTLLAMLWLKELGVQDKFVQQEDEDQEAAFQQAFSVELLLTGVLFVVMLALMPLLALAYGREELLAPGLVLALLLPGLALQAPIWLYYRELQFVRQRRLQAIDPIISIVLTIGLAAIGFGYWSFVIATVVGTWATAFAALRSLPYKLRWRLDRGVVRSYFSFSWPLFVGAFNGLVMTQTAILISEARVGLAAVAAITLGNTLWRYAMRVDDVITQTLYPVVARVRAQTELVVESFLKSNRLALMWATPFGVAFALFAPDLVEFGLGEEWTSATIILQLIGLSAVVNQIAFNWSAYYRTHGETRPLATASCIALVVFFLAPAPLLYFEGLEGYGWGILALSSVNAVVRSWYLRRLLPGLRIAPNALRAMLPTVPAVALVLCARLGWEGTRTAGIALAEFAAFSLVSVVAALVFERQLVREIGGYLRPDTVTP